MNTCSIGTLVICDTFGGLIRGKITEVRLPNVFVRVTSRKNKYYQAGNSLTINLVHVFPANCFHHVRGKPNAFYVDQFEWRL